MVSFRKAASGPMRPASGVGGWRLRQERRNSLGHHLPHALPLPLNLLLRLLDVVRRSARHSSTRLALEE